MQDTATAGISRRTFTSGAALAAMAAPVMARAQPGGATIPDAAAGAVLEALREELPIPALSGAVVRDGELVWAEARGLSDLELEVPADTASIFRLGSVSKVVTAAIGVRLAAAGVVDLDAPIASYMPDLPEHHRATTLRQLYNHKGGVRHYNIMDLSPMSPGGSIDARIYPTTDAALAIFIEDPLVAEPGTSANYSTFGYTLISAVLEAASGASFVDLIRREVAEPLGLGTLAAEDSFAIVPDRVGFYDPAAMYRAMVPDLPLPDVPVINSLPSMASYKYAGGGMQSTAADVARFGAAQLAGSFLDEASRDTLFTVASEASERMPALGLGWRIDEHDMLGRRFHHAGNMQGCRAQLALYPDHGLSVSLMTNLGGLPGPILNYTDRIAARFIA